MEAIENGQSKENLIRINSGLDPIRLTILNFEAGRNQAQYI